MIEYILIIQNNSTKQSYVFSGLTNANESGYYLKFDNFRSLVEEHNLSDGEYQYALIKDEGYTIEPKPIILDTIAIKDGVSRTLRQLNASTGILKIGEVKSSNIYNENKKEYIAYER